MLWSRRSFIISVSSVMDITPHVSWISEISSPNSYRPILKSSSLHHFQKVWVLRNQSASCREKRRVLCFLKAFPCLWLPSARRSHIMILHMSSVTPRTNRKHPCVINSLAQWCANLISLLWKRRTGGLTNHLAVFLWEGLPLDIQMDMWINSNRFGLNIPSGMTCY